MKVLLFLVFLAVYTSARCQNFNEIDNLFKQKKFNEAIAACTNYIKTDTTNARVYDEIGRCYNAVHQYGNAIPYFEKAIAMDGDSTFLTGWAYCDMGLAHIKSGDEARGRQELYKTVELGQTRNSVNTALNILRNMAKGKDITAASMDENLNTIPNWVVMEGAHIKYFFEDTFGISYLVQKFIARHEQAFDTLNTVFEAKLPVKITYYVWLSEERARRVLHCGPLGFATPENYTVNTRINQTVGHEMTHVLSYWAWGSVPVNTSKFIDEGVASAFNLDGMDKIAKARRAVEGKNLNSVLNIWEEGTAASEDLIYPVGGAFLQFLYRNGSFSDFKKLIKDQTIPAAKEIYGKQKLSDLVQQFDKLIGLK
jgi:tetratricopeptide (TPR) repeat protein